VITLDTSGIVAVLNKHDTNHRLAVDALSRRTDHQVVPAPILSEVAFVLESRGHSGVLDQFLDAIDRGELTIDCCEGDIGRVRRLMKRYADLPLGFADAITIACAERSGGDVLTFDHRHFGVVAREGEISVVPGFGREG
jgi:uncharacterized protein